MSKTINKKKILHIVIATYIVISAIFILIVLWNTFLNYYSNNAFQQGQEIAIEQLINAAEDPSCQAIPIYSGDRQVSLINTDCLQLVETETE